MEPIDIVLAALFLAIVIYILNGDSDGGRRDRLRA
jgi:hypothetical protein